MMSARTQGPVKIVGTGLIGTSIGLALGELGVEVFLEDSSPGVIDLAVDFGAGKKYAGAVVDLVVVAVPPDVTAQVVADQLKLHPQATITDVSSVKAPIVAKLLDQGLDLANYVGSHPMAGREVSGVLAGRSDIFTGRPWVIAANPQSSPQAIAKVEALALDLGATLVSMDPNSHDRAVALVSHAPQLVASLMAAQLIESEPSDVSLAGAGLRDTTRIAASDPRLWLQILTANSAEVVSVLRDLRVDLEELISALEKVSETGSLAKIGKVLERGNRGVASIPGKHGERATTYGKVVVMIDDKPGELARLLTEVGDIGINLEDLTLQHATGAQVGLPELYVIESVEHKLREELTQRGWKLVG